MPNIDWSTIEGFNEEMNAEERLALYEASPERENPALTAANARIAELEADIRAHMSEEEKAAAEQAATQKELAKLRRDNALAQHRATFIAQGYEAKLADTAANAMVDGNHAALFDCMQKHLAATEKRVKEEALRGTPHPPAGKSESVADESAAERLAKRLAQRNTPGSKSTADVLARYM